MTLIARSALFTPKPDWRLGSASTRWGAYSSSPHSLAALRGWDAGRKRRGKGGEEGKEREGGERREGKRGGKLTVMAISYFRSCQQDCLIDRLPFIINEEPIRVSQSCSRHSVGLTSSSQRRGTCWTSRLADVTKFIVMTNAIPSQNVGQYV